MSEIAPLSSKDISFYRRPWFFFLSILLLWPLSLLLMLTGKTYYLKRGGQIVPMKRWSKALLGVVILFAGLLFYAGIAANKTPAHVAASNASSENNVVAEDQSEQATNDAAPVATSNDEGTLASCDGDDTKATVKQILEDNNHVQVLDMGKAQEVSCPALNMNDGSCMPVSSKERFCNAAIYLNTGQTTIKYHMFYGPSGKLLIEIKEGYYTDWSKVK